MVKVQSLEDVKKVMASSLPKRLEAGVRRTTAAEVEKYGLPRNHGVVIGWLDPKGPLGRAGLNIGDIIVQVDNQPIAGLEDFVGLVDSLGVRQAATFYVVDKRTGNLRNVMIVVGENQRLQEPRGGFFSRNVEAAVAGIKKAAQSVKEHVGHVAEMGKGAYTTVIQGLKKWVGEAEEAHVSVKEAKEPSP
jgi:predicted metalloprotease with PDZ domain